METKAQPIGVAMASTEKSTARVVAVIALLFVTALALRGYLPGDEPVADRQRPANSSAALIIDIALLGLSVAIIGIAIVARLRDRQARRPGPGTLPRSPGTIGRPTWRFSLIAGALIIGWLLVVVALMQPGVGGPVDHTPTRTDSGSAGPDANPVWLHPDSPSDTGPNVVGYLVAPMLILLALVVVGTIIASRRQRRVTSPWPGIGGALESSAEPGAVESLARAAEVGLVEIGDLGREPREAIIACYAAMEGELANVPGAAPLDCDTPSEVLARAVGRHALNADSATRLVELFEEARFSPHVMNESHRDDAVGALRLVLADLRSMA